MSLEHVLDDKSILQIVATDVVSELPLLLRDEESFLGLQKPKELFRKFLQIGSEGSVGPITVHVPIHLELVLRI